MIALDMLRAVLQSACSAAGTEGFPSYVLNIESAGDFRSPLMANCTGGVSVDTRSMHL